jgi:hypothetical protein
MLRFLSAAFMFHFEFENPIWTWNKKSYNNKKQKRRKCRIASGPYSKPLGPAAPSPSRPTSPSPSHPQPRWSLPRGPAHTDTARAYLSWRVGPTSRLSGTNTCNLVTLACGTRWSVSSPPNRNRLARAGNHTNLAGNLGLLSRGLLFSPCAIKSKRRALAHLNSGWLLRLRHGFVAVWGSEIRHRWITCTSSAGPQHRV